MTTNDEPERRGTLVRVAGAGLLLLAVLAPGLLPLLPARSDSSVELGFLAEFEQPAVIAFAGYAGCGTTCPTRLAVMARAGAMVGPEAAGLAFVDVDETADPAASLRYARAFHPEFRSFTVDDVLASALRGELAVPTFADTRDRPGHPGNVFLFERIERGWRIAAVYRRAPDPARIARDVRAIAGRA